LTRAWTDPDFLGCFLPGTDTNGYTLFRREEKYPGLSCRESGDPARLRPVLFVPSPPATIRTVFLDSARNIVASPVSKEKGQNNDERTGGPNPDTRIVIVS
jgi:hypothetical protein